MVDKPFRARQPHHKEARRMRLLEAAAEALDARPFQDITLQEVAQASGIAKGTAYGYFDSKGSLFLALLEGELEAWVSHLENLPRPRSGSLAPLLAADLEARPRLLTLLSVVHALIEPTVTPERLVAFKLVVLTQVHRMAAALHRLKPSLPEAQAIPLILHLYAGLVGLAQVTSLPPRLSAVLDDPRFAPLRVDRSTTLQVMVAALLKEPW